MILTVYTSPNSTLMKKAGKWFGHRHLIILYSPKPWSLVHGFYIQMGGLLLCDNDSKTAIQVLQVDELLELMREGKVDQLQISEGDIWDKSKGDLFMKLFAVLQTTWFIFQCIFCWVAQLPITELEVMTLSFAALNIITYALWWQKPQDVIKPIPVWLKNVSQCEEAGAESTRMFNPDLEEDITDHNSFPSPDSTHAQPEPYPLSSANQSLEATTLQVHQSSNNGQHPHRIQPSPCAYENSDSKSPFS